MTSAAQRQAKAREKKRVNGLESATIWLPRGSGAIIDANQIAQFLCRHPHLTFGPAVDPESGKFVSWRKDQVRRICCKKEAGE